MKAPAFDYLRPRDLDEACRALQGQPATAKLIAGGQSLLPMLNLRLARPTLLIDVSRIEVLRAIEDRGRSVRIGAAVTHAELEDRDIPDCGMLRAVAGGIAYRSVRNRGTIGGSMAHADPAADWPLALAALGGTVIVQGEAGLRQIPASDFMQGAFTTRVGERDIIIAIDVPKLSAAARYGYFKFCRKTGEFPEASAAAVFDPEAKVARLYVGALPGAPQPLDELAEALARDGLPAASDAAIAAAVDAIPHLDLIARRMQRSAVARAVKQVFAS
jgi:aerobic carbon-monoxide dehydrogenase medium subunit